MSLISLWINTFVGKRSEQSLNSQSEGNSSRIRKKNQGPDI